MPEDEESYRSTSMKIYSEWCAKKTVNTSNSCLSQIYW